IGETHRRWVHRRGCDSQAVPQVLEPPAVDAGRRPSRCLPQCRQELLLGDGLLLFRLQPEVLHWARDAMLLLSPWMFRQQLLLGPVICFSHALHLCERTERTTHFAVLHQLSHSPLPTSSGRGGSRVEGGMMLVLVLQ